MSHFRHVGFSFSVPKSSRSWRVRSERQMSPNRPSNRLPIRRSSTASTAATQLHASTLPSGRTIGPLFFEWPIRAQTHADGYWATMFMISLKNIQYIAVNSPVLLRPVDTLVHLFIEPSDAECKMRDSRSHDRISPVAVGKDRICNSLNPTMQEKERARRIRSMHLRSIRKSPTIGVKMIDPPPSAT
jgi:hypothetical protein